VEELDKKKVEEKGGEKKKESVENFKNREESESKN